MSANPPGLPIELRLCGNAVLVVGLGPVGRRRAAALVAAGARVVGVDPAASGLADVIPAGVEVRAEPYDPRLLKGMSLAVAAGPRGLNRRVVRDARGAGVWACSASDPAEGDFTWPAVRRSGPLMVAVSTSGASPGLAAALCARAVEALGPAAAGLAALLVELRPLVQARLTDPRARRRVLRDWADSRWLTLWVEAGPQAVRDALMQRIEDESPRAGGLP